MTDNTITISSDEYKELVLAQNRFYAVLKAKSINKNANGEVDKYDFADDVLKIIELSKEV